MKKSLLITLALVLFTHLNSAQEKEKPKDFEIGKFAWEQNIIFNLSKSSYAEQESSTAVLASEALAWGTGYYTPTDTAYTSVMFGWYCSCLNGKICFTFNQRITDADLALLAQPNQAWSVTDMPPSTGDGQTIIYLNIKNTLLKNGEVAPARSLWGKIKAALKKTGLLREFEERQIFGEDKNKGKKI